MVSVLLVEYRIHPTQAILTLVGVWKVIDVMVNAFEGQTFADKMVKYIILTKFTLFQISDKGEDGLGGVDPVLYQQDWDHVLDGIVDEVVGTSNLLEMVLGVMEGLIMGGFYLDSIFDPSAVDRSDHAYMR